MMEPDKYYLCKKCVNWQECKGFALAEDSNDCVRGGPWWTEEAKKEIDKIWDKLVSSIFDSQKVALYDERYYGTTAKPPPLEGPYRPFK